MSRGASVLTASDLLTRLASRDEASAPPNPPGARHPAGSSIERCREPRPNHCPTAPSRGRRARRRRRHGRELGWRTHRASAEYRGYHVEDPAAFPNVIACLLGRSVWVSIWKPRLSTRTPGEIRLVTLAVGGRTTSRASRRSTLAACGLGGRAEARAGASQLDVRHAHNAKFDLAWLLKHGSRRRHFRHDARRPDSRRRRAPGPAWPLHARGGHRARAQAEARQDVPDQ